MLKNQLAWFPVSSGSGLRRRVLALVVFLAAGWCAAQDDDESGKVRDFLEEEHALSQDFVTPHTEWAKPYAGGALRVLFFAPWFQGSTDAREIVEIAQRLEVQASAVYYEPGAHWVGDGRPDWYGNNPKAGTERMLRLVGGHQDAFFVNQVKWDAFPQEARDRIRNLVAQGAGLVMVTEQTAVPFEAAQSVKQPPAGLPGLLGYTLGKGRVAVLPPRAKIAYTLGWETQFDYQMEQQVRALLWAAQREPKSRLTVGLASPSIARATLPAESVKLTWNAMPATAALRVDLRRWDGVRQRISTLPVSGDGTAAVSLPKVRGGEYHLEVFAMCSQAVENWALASFTVEPEQKVEDVVLAKDWAEVGETVTGTAKVAGALTNGRRVQARLVDRYGRVLDQDFLAPKGNAVSFQFHIEPWMPMLLRVEVALLDDAGEVSSAYVFLRVTNRHRDQFNFVMWNVATGDLAPYGIQSLARNGVTAVLQGGNPPLAFAENELSYIPYATSFRASSHTLTAMLDPETGVLKTGCVYDEKKLHETIQSTVQALRGARELGVFAYSLGDENAVRASCLSTDCLMAYRRYLAQVYGEIAALNREWNTDYATFDEIQLLADKDLPAANAPEAFKEYFAERQQLHRTDSEGAQGEGLEKQVAFGNTNDEMGALQAGNYARWYDRQAFQSYTYVQWCKAYQEAFRALDPQAWTGFEGTDSFSLRRYTTRSRQGGDIDSFVRELDYFGPYIGPANEVVRSIARPGFPMGNWIGYSPDADTLLKEYWGQVTNQMNTIQWWRWDNLDGYHGYLKPDLSPFPATRELLDDTQIVRDGLGTLLMRCTMEDDAIAMLYSMPSTHIAHFDGNETYGNYTRDHALWHTQIHDAGLQFRYVTDRMLRNGEFDAARYKVLLLPLAFAMSPEEAEAVRSFVRQGGTVIADVRPAVYDGHCKPLDAGLLDDVFGIRREGKRNAREIDRMRVNGTVQGKTLEMQWGNWQGHDVYPAMKVDPCVQCATGKALGQADVLHYTTGVNAPVCVVNEFGKGRAVLLNFSLYGAPAGKLLQGLLAAASIEPAVRVARPGGTVPKGVEITRWHNGAGELLALLPDADGDMQVNLPKAFAVYDLKARRALGNGKTFQATLHKNRASFFALLPKESAVELTAPKSAKLGDTAKVTVRIAHAAGGHPVKLQLADPQGRTAEWFEKTVITEGGPVAVPVPFASNDPKGEWELRATDILSGASAVQRIRLDAR